MTTIPGYEIVLGADPGMLFVGTIVALVAVAGLATVLALRGPE